MNAHISSGPVSARASGDSDDVIKGVVAVAMGLLALVALALIVALILWLSRGKIEARDRRETAEMFEMATPEAMSAPVQSQPTQTVPAPTPDTIVDNVQVDANAPPSPVRAAASAATSFALPGIASRAGPSGAYANVILRLIQRHLRRDEALRQEAFDFDIRVRVAPDASVEVIAISNVTPSELRAAIERALIGVGPAEAPPPDGTTDIINLRYRQTG